MVYDHVQTKAVSDLRGAPLEDGETRRLQSVTVTPPGVRLKLLTQTCDKQVNYDAL